MRSHYTLVLISPICTDKRTTQLHETLMSRELPHFWKIPHSQIVWGCAPLSPFYIKRTWAFTRKCCMQAFVMSEPEASWGWTCRTAKKDIFVSPCRVQMRPLFSHVFPKGPGSAGGELWSLPPHESRSSNSPTPTPYVSRLWYPQQHRAGEQLSLGFCWYPELEIQEAHSEEQPSKRHDIAAPLTHPLTPTHSLL